MRTIVEQYGISAELTVEWGVYSGSGQPMEPRFEIIAYGPHDRTDLKQLVTLAEQNFLELTVDGGHVRVALPSE